MGVDQPVQQKVFLKQVFVGFGLVCASLDDGNRVSVEGNRRTFREGQSRNGERAEILTLVVFFLQNPTVAEMPRIAVVTPERFHFHPHNRLTEFRPVPGISRSGRGGPLCWMYELQQQEPGSAALSGDALRAVFVLARGVAASPRVPGVQVGEVPHPPGRGENVTSC